ncbi:unnamed protein product [Amoebophrya sp. A25]|nr:unnamed protein product [Amoebophrya sp. A25]|eukprot:GSA25T00011260001.1
MKRQVRREKRAKVKYDALEKVCDVFGWQEVLAGERTIFTEQAGIRISGLHESNLGASTSPGPAATYVAREDVDLASLPPEVREAWKMRQIQQREQAKRKEPASETTLRALRDKILERFGYEPAESVRPRRLEYDCGETAPGIDNTPAENKSLECSITVAPAKEVESHMQHMKEHIQIPTPITSSNSPASAAREVDHSTVTTLYPYRPYAFLPAELPSARSLQFVDDFFRRGQHYAAKFSAQEASLLEQLHRLECDGDTIVIDLGCGNATLVILAHLVFGSYAVGIDRRTPHANCQGERYFTDFNPPIDFLRIEDCVSRWQAIWSMIESEVVRKHFIMGRRDHVQKAKQIKLVVLCKHLCGTGTDYCIQFMEKLSQITKVDDTVDITLAGAVFATCCTHKISTDPSGTDLRFFVKYYGASTTHGTSAAVSDSCENLTRAHEDDNSTTTSSSSLPSPTRRPGASSADFQTPLLSSHIPEFSQLCRWAAWRNTEQSADSKLSEEHIRIAEICDDVVQAMRMKKLRSFFRTVRQITYVPTSNSMQNRAIICETLPATAEKGNQDENDTRNRDVVEEVHETTVCCTPVLDHINSRLSPWLAAGSDLASPFDLASFHELLDACEARHRRHLPVTLAAHDLYNNDE